ncbi:hypothetical protein [Carboxylicivirga caseinilyticus]|uniref:hypothetical protein n=1 Tax=Carboxylicivirga caseinilyticus TaxID=3417572 RepID=UPI003D331EFD|nr:hypothetical protein [Marinilabiliaceae bacterium A049]
MRIEILNILIISFVIGVLGVGAQSLSLEGNAFSSVYSATISARGNINKANTLDYSLMSRFDGDYETINSIHTLLFGTMGRQLLPSIKATAGAIYSSGGQVQPSLGIQWYAKMKNWLIMLYPNVNISSQSDLMQIAMLKYSLKAKKTIWYTQGKSLSIINDEGHQFTTIRVQAGIDRGRIQGGISNDINLFGSSFDAVSRLGLFLAIGILKKDD